MICTVCTIFDLVKPDQVQDVKDKQAAQKESHHEKSRVRELEVNDTLTVRNYKKDGHMWMPGTIVSKDSSVLYLRDVIITSK